MGKLRESSMLFSLEELFRIEQHRVDAERADRAARAEQERNERAEREAREQAARQKAIEDQQRRRIERERAAREEQSRLLAQHEAALERARVEAKLGVERELLRQRQEHQTRLVEIEARGRARRLRVTSAVLALGCIGALVAALAQRMNASERERALADARRLEIAQRDEQLRLARAELQELGERNRQLKSELEQRPATPIPAPPQPSTREPKRPVRDAPPVRRRPNEPPRCVHDGDPLNGCLGP